MAYIADCLRRKTIQEREDAKYGHEHEKVEGRPEDQGTIVDKNLVDFYNKGGILVIACLHQVLQIRCCNGVMSNLKTLHHPQLIPC